MLYGSRMTLTSPGERWSGMRLEPLVIAHPIPLHRPALEDIEAHRAKSPETSVDDVRPPGDAKPFLMNQEKSAVKEEERELDEEEGRSLQNHGYPDELKGSVSICG